MTDRDPTVAAVLDRFVPHVPGGRDWPDVLRRAGVARRARRIAAVVAVVAVVAASSALAASDGLRTLVGLSRAGTVTLVADLGRGAQVRFEASGTVIAHGRRGVIPRRLVPVVRLRLFHGIAVRWRLDGAAGRRLVLRSNGGVVARLCAPCRDGQAGRLVLAPAPALAFFNGRAEAWLGVRHAPVKLLPR
jgi:hypothetical protein